MAYNKFIKKDGTVMLDLTDTTVSAETLGKDITAVDKYGNKIVGTLTDSPIPIEVSTEEEMTALLESGEGGSVYKYVGETGTYENEALYVLEGTEEADPLQGTWIFNNDIDISETEFYVELNFISNSNEYAIFQITGGTPNSIAYKTPRGMSQVIVFRDNFGWYDEVHKTIEITSTYDEVSTLVGTVEQFLSWLQANATKQPSKDFAKLIIPTGTLDITANGEYDVTEYANANVSVESGGSAEFNIAYGDTEPTDTSKLWVKASEPSEVQVTTKPVYVVDELQYGIASLPTATSGIGTTSVGTNIYLFGGVVGSLIYSNTINLFNTETNTITTLDVTLPTVTSGIGTASVGRNIYLFGGRNGNNNYLNRINIFNTETNSITTLSVTLPTAADYIGAASVGTNIYLFGGSTSESALNTINIFNTETNTVTTLDVTLPTAASRINVASVGTNIYLFGGVGSSRLNTINVFNTETNSITTLDTTLPTGTINIGVASVGTNIYLFGGYSGSNLNTINVFNTETNTVTTLDVTLPTAASGIGTASVGTKIYLFGGSGSSILNTINAFILGLSLPTNNMLLEATLVENTFNLLPNVEIGVKNVYIGNADGIGEKVEASLYKDDAWTNI